MTQAYLAIQCTDSKERTGTFLFNLDAVGQRVAVSPVFESLMPFYDWAEENGWTGDYRDPAHPVGTFTKG